MSYIHRFKSGLRYNYEEGYCTHFIILIRYKVNEKDRISLIKIEEIPVFSREEPRKDRDRKVELFYDVFFLHIQGTYMCLYKYVIHIYHIHEHINTVPTNPCYPYNTLSHFIHNLCNGHRWKNTETVR